MILLMVTTFREEPKIFFLFERNFLSDHPTHNQANTHDLLYYRPRPPNLAGV